MEVIEDFKFKTAQDFSLFIELQVIEHKISHVDAILKFCEENYLEPDEVTKYVSPALMEKLKANFYELNYFPKVASLEQYL